MINPLKIMIYGNPKLRKSCVPVDVVTPELVELANLMLDKMYMRSGIGLASPQVGKDIRLIVVDISLEEKERTPYIMFNPILVEQSGKSEEDEGCLSLPGIFASVERSDVITIEYLDINNIKQTLSASGILARCIQHEIDHLNGILFVDKISMTEQSLHQGKLKHLSKYRPTLEKI